MKEDQLDAGSAGRDETPRDIEAVLLSVWRRAIDEGCGPEMTLSEAAAVLGSTVANVRRRVADGVIPAYRDARGALRIVPRLPVSAGEPKADSSEPLGMVGWLREELRRAQNQLNQAMQEKTLLQREVTHAEQSLAHMREEITAMWRLLAARTSEAKPTRLKHSAPIQNEISKIQAQVTEVRKLARRRKWPWALLDSA